MLFGATSISSCAGLLAWLSACLIKTQKMCIDLSLSLFLSLYVYIYLYIYTHTPLYAYVIFLTMAILWVTHLWNFYFMKCVFTLNLIIMGFVSNFCFLLCSWKVWLLLHTICPVVFIDFNLQQLLSSDFYYRLVWTWFLEISIYFDNEMHV